MEEGDRGDIGGVGAPAREVAAPTRRTDLPGELPPLLTVSARPGGVFNFVRLF
jgi:hypothetical protein